MYGHAMFSGPERTLQLWFKADDDTAPVLRHTIEAHDVGVNDGTLADPYGFECKCPPGTFSVGVPEPCATRNADGTVTRHNANDPAYGCFFTLLSDKGPDGPMAQHHRAGIGVHGGGTNLPDPFALKQGWLETDGCIRLQNEDNEQTWVPFVKYILDGGGTVDLTVTGTDPGPRGTGAPSREAFRVRTDLAVALDAAIVAVSDDQPRVLVRAPDDALPAGPFEPEHDRTLELGLRRWVTEQTGLALGHVEQLYTFGDRDRDPRLADGPRMLSVAYLAFVRETEPARGTGARWRGWYDYFPWEDWRAGRPAIVDAVIVPAVEAWVRAASGDARRERETR